MPLPLETVLSKHFTLFDFVHNHSVYSGIPNVCEIEEGSLEHRNIVALCEHGLEPILQVFGPISIGYGYISPSFSRATVKYQDPNKPSHHRWDLGAAVDIRVHKYVDGTSVPTIRQVQENDYTRTSPASLAHDLDEIGIPYSRLITYSESPFICLAISSAEVENGTPRRAFYENRYQGKPKAKPRYIQQPTASARSKVSAELREKGLPVDWRGAGYPTYHGGGYKQRHHVQVSRYTTLLDWLRDPALSLGISRKPQLLNMSREDSQDAIAAAGIIYDYLIEHCDIPYITIRSGVTKVGDGLYAFNIQVTEYRVTEVCGALTQLSTGATTNGLRWVVLDEPISVVYVPESVIREVPW